MLDAIGGLFIVFIAAYLTPTIVAAARGHQNLMAIAALNILLGWTFVGWVVAFVWSLTSNVAAAKEPGMRPWFEKTLPSREPANPLEQRQMPPRQQGESFSAYTSRIKSLGYFD